MTRLLLALYKIIGSLLSAQMSFQNLNAGKYTFMIYDILLANIFLSPLWIDGGLRNFVSQCVASHRLRGRTNVPRLGHWNTWHLHIICGAFPRARINFWILPPRINQQMLNATYLPDVIPEQGWTKLEAVESAMRKAGWDGPIDEAMLMSVRLKRYQSRQVTVTWVEYVEWRKMHDTTRDWEGDDVQ